VKHQAQNFEQHKLINCPDLPPTPEQQNADLEQLKEIVVELIDYKLRKNEQEIITRIESRGDIKQVA